MKEMHRVFIVFALLGTLALTIHLAAQKKEKYSITYHGLEQLFVNAESSYFEHEHVKLYTTYLESFPRMMFYLDGKQLSVNKDVQGTYVSFVMPDHDVSLTLGDKTVQHQSIVVASFYEVLTASDQKEAYELAVFSSCEEGVYILEVTDDEIITHYRMSQDILKSCLQWCEQVHPEQWHQRDDLDCLEGIHYVFQYYDKGKKIRVTSDEIPQDFINFFTEIKTMLTKTICDENLIDRKGIE